MHHLSGDADGQTPLEPDEVDQLLRSAVATREELDIVEQENIAEAMQWVSERTLKPEDVLDEAFMRRLHRRMFGRVWRWAGNYRRTARNIGVDAWRIPEEVAQLVGDARYWVEHETYDPTELCVRFHHELVSIHPFPNGNGRHARLSADILAVSLGRGPLSWGRKLDLDAAELRARYIDALRAADGGDIRDLVVFAS